MEKAAFSLENYLFDKISLDLTKRTDRDITLKFTTNGIYLSDNAIFDLHFIVNAFNEDQSLDNSFLEISCRAKFSFQNVNSFDEIPDFFYRNSIAILFPYVRAYISIVTTQSNSNGIIIPTLNLTSLESELRKNTTEK